MAILDLTLFVSFISFLINGKINYIFYLLFFFLLFV